ncbi:MAG: transposase [Nakamurella sp.]
MLTGRVFVLRVTPDQDAALAQFSGVCRAVWNTGLAQRRMARQDHRWVNYPQQCKELADVKTDPELAWVGDAPGHVLQQTLKDLDAACRSVGTWKVHFRSKFRWSASMRFPEGKRMRVQRVSKRWGQVNLPKLGAVKFRMTRELDGSIRSATVRRVDGHWQISFLVEDGVLEIAPPYSDLRPPVGVDRGVKVALGLSDGRMLDQQFTSRREQDRVAGLQRRRARQQGPRAKPSKQQQRQDPKVRCRRQEPSQRYLRTRARIAVVHAKQRRRRDDFLTKTARTLAREHSLIVLENLNTKGMTSRAAAKPDPDQVGHHLPNRAAAKSGLNRAILGKGWGKFVLVLAHQARSTGAQVVVVPPAFTSQRCHQCGHTSKDNRESQAVFHCTGCGHTANADVNAARNILAAGHAVTGRVRPEQSGSVNHQAA